MRLIILREVISLFGLIERFEMEIEIEIEIC
jgi:hypothetical protein